MLSLCSSVSASFMRSSLRLPRLTPGMASIAVPINVSLAAMEHSLTPHVLSILEEIDKKYFRPSEVLSLLGDPNKAKINLGWEPKISLEELVQEMINEDLKQARIESAKFNDLKNG